MLEDPNTLASLVDAALSFTVLATILLMFVKGILVSKPSVDRMSAMYEQQLARQEKHYEELKALYKEMLQIVREEADEQNKSLEKIMQAREKKYAAIIAALEASSNLEADIAILVRTLGMGGTVSDD